MKLFKIIFVMVLLSALGWGQLTFLPPTVTAGTTNNISWTAGTVNNGGHPVSVTAGTSTVTLNKSDCSNPGYANCNFVYANSSGTVAVTTTLGTAIASGNTLLALIETGAVTTTQVVYPWQSGTMWLGAGGPFVSFSAAPVPSSAGGVNLGTNALPWAGLFFGTAATNNFQIVPTTTTAARTFNVCDPGANGAVCFGDQTTPTKDILLDSHSATAATTLTLADTVTANRTVTFTDPGGAANVAYANPTTTQNLSGLGTVAPATAGGASIGTAALPWGTVFIGTAATNNQTLTPLATGAARTIQIADQGANGAVAFGDQTTPTKVILLDSHSATAATTLTLADATTVNRTLTFPDATDTLVGKGTTDTFTVAVKTFGAPTAGTGGQFFMATGGTKPTTVTQGGIYWEPTQNSLVAGENSGNPIVLGGAFQVLPQQTGLTTITTAQTLNGLTAVTLPAGAMNVIGKTMHVHGMGIFSNGATTPTVAISLKIGSVVELIPTSVANANTNTNSPFYFDFYVVTAATGATGNDQAHGYLMEDTVNNTPGGLMGTFGDVNTAVSGNWDHTASQTVLLQITCGGAACTAATLLSATFEMTN